MGKRFNTGFKSLEISDFQFPYHYQYIEKTFLMFPLGSKKNKQKRFFVIRKDPEFCILILDNFASEMKDFALIWTNSNFLWENNSDFLLDLDRLLFQLFELVKFGEKYQGNQLS